MYEIDFINKTITGEHADVLQVGDNVENINENCVHYGSKGKVVAMLKLPNEMGNVVAYQCSESGKTENAEWNDGDVLLKTESQLRRVENDKSEADEKAGYPPNCKKGFVKKGDKCVPKGPPSKNGPPSEKGKMPFPPKKGKK